MSDIWEYRIAISEGPLSASQLTQEFGSQDWELVDVIKWPHGEVDPDTGEPPQMVWNYFKREKVAKSATVVELTSTVDRNTDGGTGLDEIGVKKE